mgnify:CR=1 FL=1
MRSDSITSAQNPKIKTLLELQEKSKTRRKEGLFVVEGRRELLHCIEAGYEPYSIFFCPEIICGKDLEEIVQAAGNCSFFEIPQHLYDKVAYRGGTEGVIAELRCKEMTLEALELKENPLVVVLEAVEKPGNLGAVLRSADKILLPGVGAFEDAVKKLRQSHMDEMVYEAVREGKPLMGICLGMQLLFDESCEYGIHKGLGFVSGKIASLAEDLGESPLKVPHIGWNSLKIVKDDPLFQYVKDGEYVYYVHSFYGKDCEASTLATSEYGLSVTGVVRQGLVWGTQFHPEKSGDTGLRLLKAFGEL